ncbi:MAG TPA: glycoside hydrolase family 36 protein, partial [Conexibacter sp.]|nr:glycoside hydrolase family 36 protein [Conexibacter sp.]
DDVVPVGARVPFGVVGGTAVEWHEPALVQRGDRAWELTAGSRQGLEVTWGVIEHPDTRAVECSGLVHNTGTTAFEDVRQLRTLDLSLGLTEAWGEPFARTVNGCRFMPNFYPPDDFRPRDRQLLRTPQMNMPLHVEAAADGRSSAAHLPVAILAGEDGDRGLALFYEWSGLWSIRVEQAPSPRCEASWPWALRIKAGMWGLALDMRPGGKLRLPNLLIAGFDGDLDAGGNALRRHVARHVAPPLGGEPALPPTSFNTWFGFRNDISTRLLEPAVAACAQAGIEYFCVDAGWFPPRFREGLGNWSRPIEEKFPGGIAPFASHVAEQGMRLGLWFEPEYAHVDSDVFKAHPDWFLQGPGISPWMKPDDPFYMDGTRDIEGLDYRGQDFGLIDFGHAEARQWAIDLIVEAYERWGVRWIRWDHNQQPRPHWEAIEQAGRVGINQIHHINGLYEVLGEILRACPDLFVEQCAGGGNRIDLGTVRRGHAFWMNDHTSHSDIVRALQQGLNTVLPGIYANTNMCQERFDYDDYDYLSHGCGSFGFSGRLWEAPPADFERYRAAVERFKGYRHLLAGDYTHATGRLDGRWDPVEVAWSDGQQTVEMQFNAGGVSRSATLSLS